MPVNNQDDCLEKDKECTVTNSNLGETTGIYLAEKVNSINIIQNIDFRHITENDKMTIRAYLQL